MEQRRIGRRRQRHAPGQRPEAEASRAASDRPDVPDLAAYIAQLASEMARLANEARLDLLAYLLSMAVNEAAGLARAARSEPEE